MKIYYLSLLLTFLTMTIFTACTSTKTKTLDSNAHQQVNNATQFPAVKRPRDNVNCRNCYATFKISQANQKQAHGHSFMACPVCHQDYLKKSK